ncbi:MAG: hypothetical protein ACJAVI_001417 [Candidatus Azotimanducaceae bacterium]|jgi:hypothetical protein
MSFPGQQTKLNTSHFPTCCKQSAKPSDAIIENLAITGRSNVALNNGVIYA